MDLIHPQTFAVERALQLDARTGLETVLVVVKRTFGMKGQALVPLEEQPKVQLVDTYRGEPAQSSVRAAGELVPFKPATDVLLEGFAYSQPSARDRALVGVRVGAWQKGVQVLGDRVWEKSLGQVSASAPKPFLKLELTHERAYGGTDVSDPKRGAWCEENPVGAGFRAPGSKLPVEGAPLPNLETVTVSLRAPGQKVPSAGVGPIAPHWLPRRGYSGTMDERWLKEVCPLLPADFDERFHQAAPADQILPGHLRGGEKARVVGCTPEGAWDFELPMVRPEIVFKVGMSRETPPVTCDTLTIDTEARTVTLLWRTRLAVQGRVEKLHWIKVEERH